MMYIVVLQRPPLNVNLALRSYDKPLKKIIMNTVFSLLLTAMCGVSGYEACFATNMDTFVLGSSAMCMSAIMFLIHAKYPLFK